LHSLALAKHPAGCNGALLDVMAQAFQYNYGVEEAKLAPFLRPLFIYNGVDAGTKYSAQHFLTTVNSNSWNLPTVHK
jgi:hypothetical protein